jgi:hypothetical protein
MPPRPGYGTELTTRSDAADLPPLAAVAAGHVAPTTKVVQLLDAEAELDTWRIVEVFSRSLAPFDVDLSWSAGSGSGATAKVTVTRSARICLFARSLRVAAANLSAAANRVGVTVGDGFAVTENVYEVRGRGEGLQDVQVPPFARRARLDMSDDSVLALSKLRILDGLGALRAVVVGSNQPDDGVPLGDAGIVQVEPRSQVDWRVVFTLSL